MGKEGGKDFGVRGLRNRGKREILVKPESLKSVLLVLFSMH